MVPYTALAFALEGGINYRVPVLQPWLTKIIEKLPADQQAEFKGKAQTAIKYLIGKIKDLQL